jgi:hypothetical protein
MIIKETRILQNGALAGYVYYNKEKKWKWRIIGRNEKKGGGKDEIIEELKQKGKYDEWVKYGSLFGYINKNPRLVEYININGKPERFSLISKSYTDSEGSIIIPVFKWVKSHSQNSFSITPTSGDTIKFIRPIFSTAGPAIPSIRRNLSSTDNNIITPERLEEICRSFIGEKYSLLILIGEQHNIDVEINAYIQYLILEIINRLSTKRIPIYSEMPRELMAEINRNNNKNFFKISKMEKLTFLRIYYYLKYLQKPSGKNYIIPSNVSFENRVNKSCNLEYSEDIKKICQENDITVGIMGVKHIKCMKDNLDNNRLENGKILKVITIISNTHENMLKIVDKCQGQGKLSKNNSKNSYDLACDALIDSILLDIPNISKLSKDISEKLFSTILSIENE